MKFQTKPVPLPSPVPCAASTTSVDLPALAADRIRHSVVHDVIHTITDPWKPGIVLLLWLGETRFTGLANGLRISRSTLTQRLGQLVDDGCVARVSGENQEACTRATYQLTPKGRDLMGIVLLNRQWNTRWNGGSRLLPDLRLTHECGASLALHMVCTHCEQEVRARDVKVLQTSSLATRAAEPAPLAYRRARHHRTGASGEPVTGEELACDRWTSLLLAMAFLGLRRNSEFEQAIGIAPNILANRLATLTTQGIFDRVPYQWSPERHEYRLTPKGLDRYAVILAMMLWGRRWMQPGSQLGWNMLHKSCHEWLTPRLACRSCCGDAGPDNIHCAHPPVP